MFAKGKYRDRLQLANKGVLAVDYYSICIWYKMPPAEREREH